MADLNSAAELLLGKLVAEKYGADFFMLDQYPSAVRFGHFLFMYFPNHTSQTFLYDAEPGGRAI